MIHEKDNSMLSSSDRHFIKALMLLGRIKYNSLLHETLIIGKDLIEINIDEVYYFITNN
jgi:hypothetical protein